MTDLEVRVRHVDDVSSVFLADVPFFEVEDVIPYLKNMGGVDGTLTGSFVYDPDNVPGTAYYEVLIDT